MRDVPMPLRLRPLFGGTSTIIGWVWIAVFSWFMVGMARCHMPAPLDTPRLPARISTVGEATFYGESYFVADFHFRDARGEVQIGRSMSKQRPAVGDHEVAVDDGYPILVGMLSVPEPLPLGLMLLTLAGFVMMSFEVVAGVRTIRALRVGTEPLADTSWTAWLLLALPAYALIRFAQAVYYFFAFR